MKRKSKTSPIHVWCSNELEHLAGRLIDNIEARNASPIKCLFSMPEIIVPNASIQTYLKYEFARQVGIATGLEFYTVAEFLSELLPEQDKQSRRLSLLGRDSLRSFFLELLCEELPGQPMPEPVAAYLAVAGSDANALDLRRFQLASQLAALTHRYGEWRPDLLHNWAAGNAVIAEDAFAGTEQWQRALWSGILDTIQRASSHDRWVLPATFFSTLDVLDFNPRGEIHVFGFSYAWRGLREMFDRLREKTSVNIYTFSPSEQFWEQLANFASSPDRPLIFHGQEGLHLIENWARPGLEYIQLLSEIRPIELHVDFVKNAGHRVLDRLRREILQNSPENDGPLSLTKA
jgi:exodeoxyribonuclease V gamma subunit